MIIKPGNHAPAFLFLQEFFFTVFEMLQVSVRSHDIFFHPDRGLWWPAEKMLVIADLHFGKVTHFRKSGIAVPQASFLKDIARLKNILHELTPLTCLFLGDLFHSKMNTEWKLLEETFYEFPAVDFILVKGNHDRALHESLSPRLRVVDEMQVQDILFTHDEVISEAFNISGHVHPSITIGGRARQYLTFPCFALNSDQMLMPAFGSFTGRHSVAGEKFTQYFAVGAGKVFEVKP